MTVSTGIGRGNNPRSRIRKAGEGPHRQTHRRPDPIGLLDQSLPIAPLLAILTARIRTNRHVTGEGTWILVDPLGNTYAIKQYAVGVDDIIERHVSWVAGLYFADHDAGESGEMPTLDRLQEDLTQHGIDIGVLSDKES